jgi:hypothetical protein
MTQVRSSGATANAWGRETARRIAAKIGATMTNRASNEATLDGKRVVIKCAALKTDSVGVTYKMLDTLDSVVGAFQVDDGSFELWTLSPAAFRNGMRATRSRGAAAGKVGLVRRDAFHKHGTLIGRVHLGRAV